MSFEAQDTFQARAIKCHACVTREKKSREFIANRGDDAGVFYLIERAHD